MPVLVANSSQSCSNSSQAAADTTMIYVEGAQPHLEEHLGHKKATSPQVNDNFSEYQFVEIIVSQEIG